MGVTNRGAPGRGLLIGGKQAFVSGRIGTEVLLIQGGPIPSLDSTFFARHKAPNKHFRLLDFLNNIRIRWKQVMPHAAQDLIVELVREEYGFVAGSR
jgi:hypothetical protein